MGIPVWSIKTHLMGSSNLAPNMPSQNRLHSNSATFFRSSFKRKQFPFNSHSFFDWQEGALNRTHFIFFFPSKQQLFSICGVAKSGHRAPPTIQNSTVDIAEYPCSLFMSLPLQWAGQINFYCQNSRSNWQGERMLSPHNTNWWEIVQLFLGRSFIGLKMCPDLYLFSLKSSAFLLRPQLTLPESLSVRTVAKSHHCLLATKHRQSCSQLNGNSLV